MTKAAALQQFFSSFGITAYAAASVPDDTTFPWLTYDLATGNWYTEAVAITVNLWYYTTSEAVPNAKAQEILAKISPSYTIPCDGGLILLRPGSPFCQNIVDDTDRIIKRRYINISAEYLTVV